MGNKLPSPLALDPFELGRELGNGKLDNVDMAPSIHTGFRW
jgi:hypothetical protein